MDKRIREILRTNGKVTSSMRGQVLLTQPGPNWFGRERRREEEQTEKEGENMRDFRVRSSHLSLDFQVIGLSNSGEIGGKVDPHCKSYAWVPVLWSFDHSER